MLGVTLRSNNPERVFVIALAALVVYFLAGGRVRRDAAARILHPLSRGGRAIIDHLGPRPALLAAAIAAALAIAAAAGSTRIAGSSDVYGYVSQADLWLSGSPSVRQPWVDVTAAMDERPPQRALTLRLVPATPASSPAMDPADPFADVAV